MHAPPEAFRALFEAHAGELRRYAQRIVRSRDAAEDVVQDVFLRLWLAWGRIEVGPGTRAYLYATTRARALDAVSRLRLDAVRRDRLLAWDADDQEMEVSGDGDLVVVDAGVITRAIDRVVEGMPPRQRAVALLRVRHRRSTAEIARELGISPRTVEVHVARSTRALRAQLPALLGVAATRVAAAGPEQ